jgi:hypothetical protein
LEHFCCALGSCGADGGGVHVSVSITSCLSISSSLESSRSPPLLEASSVGGAVSGDIFRFLIGHVTSLYRSPSPLPYISSSSSFSESEADGGSGAFCSALGPCGMKIESSFSGESTFLKKDRMLVLGLTGVLAGTFVATAFFVLCFPCTGTLDLELGLGVSGFDELLGAIADSIWDDIDRANALLLSGGVGGLPIEGLSGRCTDSMASCRGFLNIATYQASR